MNRKLPIKNVPCNGCTLCCQGDAIRLLPDDNPSEYQTVPHPYIHGALMLAHKPNGKCIYLNEHGCSIHHRAPSLCRRADCRALALQLDFETARKLHLMKKLFRFLECRSYGMFRFTECCTAAQKAADLRVWDQRHKLLDVMKN